MGVGRVPAFAAGMLFAFSGYLVSISSNVPYLFAAAAVPWALWSTLGLIRAPGPGRLLATAALLAVVLFAGDPQAFAVSCGLCLVIQLSCHRKGRGWAEAAWMVSLVAMTALIAAPQLGASWSALRTGRTALQSEAVALRYSMHPLQLLELGFGTLFDVGESSFRDLIAKLLSTDMAGTWVGSVNVGMAALVLAGTAFWNRRRHPAAWLMLATAVILLALCLGKHLGLYHLLYASLPIWRGFRYPLKLLSLFTLVIAVGAGVGLEDAFRDAGARRRTTVALTAGTALSAALWLAEWWGGAFSRHLLSAAGLSSPAEMIGLLRHAFLRGTLMTALCGAVLVLAFREGAPSRWRSALVLGALFGCAFVNNGSVYLLESEDVLTTPPWVALIREDQGMSGPGGYRVRSDVRRWAIPRIPGAREEEVYESFVTLSMLWDTPALHGLESTDGYLPGATSRQALLEPDPLWPSRFAPMFSGRYVLEGLAENGSIPASPDVLGINAAAKVMLRRDPAALPRARFAPARCVGGLAEALAQLSAPGFDPTAAALVEAPGRVCAGLPAVPDGRAEIVSDAPEQVELRLTSSTGGLVVLNDAIAPGWEATTDGHPVQILATNVAVRGVLVPPGDHQLVFSYRPGWVAPSLWACGLTAVLLASAELLRRARLRNPRPAPARTTG